MKLREHSHRKVEMREDVPLTMADGTRLSVRLWLPEDASSDPVPALIEHLPYRKRDGTVARDYLTHPYFAGHGYACIRVDMRGNGDSDGRMEDEYTAQELDDACAVIAWARAQPWCSGKVGMIGISWGGFNSLQVAALQPEGLEAVVSICSSADRYADDIHTKGGCQLTSNLSWATQMLAYSARPPDPEVVGARWRDMWLDRLEHQPFLLEPWLAHQRRDAYWEHGSVCEDYGAIKAAVLAVGGWHDGYRNTPAKLMENLAAPCKAIIGPWNHKYPHFAGPAPAIGFLQECLRWWDYWLKGIDTGVARDPDMRLWLMDSVRPRAWLPERPGRWITEAAWPSAGIARAALHLTPQGLQTEPASLSHRIASPADCGMGSGTFFPAHFGPELPIDQRDDDARSACFDGAPLSAPQDIVGAPRVRLLIAADQPQAQVIVRLCDVFPDGTSALISMGCLNLAHRESHATPSPIPPGEALDIAFDLDQIAYRIPEGHRLRVAVSSAYWPFLWPAPAPVTLTLTAGSIVVPVRPRATDDEWRFEPPEAARPWNAETLRAPACTKRREIDQATGQTVVKIGIDNGEVRDRDHGLITSSRSEERWSIRPDAPQSASGEIAWENTMRRGDWRTRTACDTRLESDGTQWLWRARLRAWEGETLVFEQAWDNTIARDNV
ncbi:MAG: CocE/NonD family hydrolase [Pseudomonadota bacterium]